MDVSRGELEKTQTSQGLSVVGLPRNFVVTAAQQTYSWTVPKGERWIVLMAAASNDKRGTMARWSITRDGVTTSGDTIQGIDAINTFTSALRGHSQPITLLPGEIFNIGDRNYAVGDNISFYLRILTEPWKG